MVCKIEEFVIENHKNMTCAEMSEKYSKLINYKITTERVRNIVKKLGLDQLSISRKIRDYIKNNQDSAIEDVMERFCLSRASINNYQKDVGVKLKTRLQKEGIYQRAIIKDDSKDKKEEKKELVRPPAIYDNTRPLPPTSVRTINNMKY